MDLSRANATPGKRGSLRLDPVSWLPWPCRDPLSQSLEQLRPKRDSLLSRHSRLLSGAAWPEAPRVRKGDIREKTLVEKCQDRSRARSIVQVSQQALVSQLRLAAGEVMAETADQFPQQSGFLTSGARIAC